VLLCSPSEFGGGIHYRHPPEIAVGRPLTTNLSVCQTFLLTFGVHLTYAFSCVMIWCMSAREKERSSLGVYEDTKRRFNRAKPYESLSADEFVNELLDKWEGRR
jgi:hypothetical protein